MHVLKSRAIGVFIFLVVTSSAYAQATRTWVSGVGDDVNPCSRTAPCKTFAGAISKTAPRGIINALDPGGFGAVTITKSITIEANGALAGVVISGAVNGIIVNAAATDNVILRGLEINGLNGATNGVRVLAGNVYIENCTIDGFNIGVDVEPTSAGIIDIKDSTIRNNTSQGVLVKPGVGGSSKGSLDNVRLEHNGGGLRVEDNGNIVVRNSHATGNGFNGFVVLSNGVASSLLVQFSTAVNNGANGLAASGSQAKLTLTQTTTANNTSAGVSSVSGAQIVSCGDNKQYGNGAASSATTCPASSSI